MVKSPFRYPGGKSRWTENILSAMGSPKETADLFVGGGSVVLALAESGVETQVINDLDPWISAFWQLVASGDVDELCHRVEDTNPTVDLFVQLRHLVPKTIQDKAFHALFFNRTTFSGILTAGPIGGYQQKSKWTVDCRYNATTLVKQIKAASNLLSNSDVTVHNLDYRDVPLKDETLYLDPPYFKAGKQLYRSKVNHDEFVEWLTGLANRWVLSIDDAPELRSRLNVFQVEPQDFRYSISGSGRPGWIQGKELLVLSDGLCSPTLPGI